MFCTSALRYVYNYVDVLYCMHIKCTKLNRYFSVSSLRMWCFVFFCLRQSNTCYFLSDFLFISYTVQPKVVLLILKHDLKIGPHTRKLLDKAVMITSVMVSCILYESIKHCICLDYCMCFCMCCLYIYIFHIQHFSCLFPSLSTAHHKR